MPAKDFNSKFGYDKDAVKNTRAFIQDFVAFMDDFTDNPPNAMQGDAMTELKAAWREARGQSDSLEATLAEIERLPPTDPDHRRGKLEQAGLGNNQGLMKFQQWYDAAMDFFKVRGVRRLSRACDVASNISGSVADALGAGHAWKEVIEATKYLTGLAMEAGGR